MIFTKTNPLLFIYAFLTLICITVSLHAECFDEISFDTMSLENKVSCLESHPDLFTEQNICRVLRTIKATDRDKSIDRFLDLVTHSPIANNLTNSILIAGFGNPSFHKRHSSWKKLFSLYNKHKASEYSIIYSLINSGDFSGADTILQIFDSEGRVDMAELLLWTKVRFVMKEYSIAGQLYCRILRQFDLKDKKSSSLVSSKDLILAQFAGQLSDIEKEEATKSLDTFRKCAFDFAGADTSMLRKWFANTYNRLELFDSEMEILTSIRPSGGDSDLSTELSDLAREHFLYGRYVHALRSAKASFNLTPFNSSTKDASTLIYQSFLALGLTDSARSWIDRADLSSEKGISGAIILYQQSSQLQQSKLLIDRLGPSIAKDTFTLRQELFSGNIEKAQNLLKSMRFLQKNPAIFLLWKVRTCLFTGNVDSLSAMLDSIPEAPLAEQVSVLLRIKYRLLYLQSCPEALEAWPSIEYNIYVGNPGKSWTGLKSSSIQTNCRAYLALEISRALYDKKKVSEALAVANAFDEAKLSAEFIYFKALYLYKTGKSDKAAALLERLMLDFSDDIYSGKARLLLQDVKAK